MLMSYREFRIKLFHKINRNRKRLGIQDEFIFKSLEKNSLCIDLGANVGKVTKKLRELGHEVICFEPHPGASEELKNLFSNDDKVKIYVAAASNKNGKTRLFFHKDAVNINDSGPLSESSSIVSVKLNIDTEKFTEVQEIDLAQFVHNLPRRVNFMKMDVEGCEVDLLWRLVSSKAIEKIDQIYVETHEEKVPWLFWKLIFLRAYLKIRKINNINFDWN